MSAKELSPFALATQSFARDCIACLSGEVGWIRNEADAAAELVALSNLIQAAQERQARILERTTLRAFEVPTLRSTLDRDIFLRTVERAVRHLVQDETNPGRAKRP